MVQQVQADPRGPLQLGTAASKSKDSPPDAPKAMKLPAKFEAGQMYRVELWRPVIGVVPTHDFLPGHIHLIDGELCEKFREAIRAATPA